MVKDKIDSKQKLIIRNIFINVNGFRFYFKDVEFFCIRRVL